MHSKTVDLCFSVALLLCETAVGATEEHCPGYVQDKLNLYWGDLHVHTAYSLDAYAFGTTATPADAYAFAKGQELIMPDKTTRVALQRPLDFAAVTDHAETFDIMYLCTDPNYSTLPYCKDLRANSGTQATSSLNVFRSYLLPLIAGDKPARSPLCDEQGIDCDAAARAQWQRSQYYANEANNRCDFTAFIGNEWSATPNDQHWHRNLIFAGSAVTKDAIDYLRFPTPELMWQALEQQCKPEQGCDVIAIPHNTNFSEGGGFDVERDSDRQLALRAKYERLMEIHQSKGSSECLSENWDDYNADCGFEIAIAQSAKKRLNSNPDYIQQMNRSYARNMLSRGLISQQKNETSLNPLQLGFIGSTDNHTATPGAADEGNWKGDAWSGGDAFKQRRFKRMDYNPGGLTAVWAEENTRQSLFEALKRRQVYGTSGTRIKLRFFASTTATTDICNNTGSADYASSQVIPMGASFNAGKKQPILTVIAARDSAPLSTIEIIKGTLNNGDIVETVYSIYTNDKGFSHHCQSWSDPDYDPSQPAYWYTRVLEIPTPRWSKRLCEDMSNCGHYPDANRMIQERAWSSPIWHSP